MAIMTDYLENGLVNLVFRGSEFPPPDSIWMGLFYGDPTDEMHSKEIVGDGYKREKITFDSPQNGLIKNAHNIIFHYATKKWKDIEYVALFDGETGSTMLVHGKTKKVVSVGKDKNFVIKTHKLHVGFE